MKDGRAVQSKEAAYAVHGGAIADQNKQTNKKLFHVVSEWVEGLEVVRHGVREVGQGQTKKAIKRQILGPHSKMSSAAESLWLIYGRWIRMTGTATRKEGRNPKE